MCDTDPIKSDLTKEAFTQHWLHGRHVELERFWMLQAYIVITGAIYLVKSGDSLLAKYFGTGAGNEITTCFVLLLMLIHIIYSLFSLFASIKLSAEYNVHNWFADFILRLHGLKDICHRPLENYRLLNNFGIKNFFSFNKLTAQIYMLFISADIYLVIAGLEKECSGYSCCFLFLKIIVPIVIYIGLFIFSTKIKNRLEIPLKDFKKRAEKLGVEY